MSKKLSSIISITLMVLGIAFGIYTWVATGQTDDKAAQAGLIDPLFVWTYILVAIAVLAVLIVPIPYFISNPKKLRKTLFGTIALVAVILLAFVLSPSNPESSSDPNWLPFIEGATAKNQWTSWASVNILSVVIIGGIAVLAIIWSGLKGLLGSK